MRKVAEIEICGACLVVVDGDPAMGDAATQAACALAGEGLRENWPGLNVHGAGGENGEGWHSRSACEGCGDPSAGKRFAAVVLAAVVLAAD